MDPFFPHAVMTEHASLQPNAQAMILDGRTVTYGEFFEHMMAFSGWLLHNGFTPGEVTGICIRDDLQHLVCAMALLCLSTPQISLGSHETGTAKRTLADNIGVTQLVVDQTDDWMEGRRLWVAPIRDSAGFALVPAPTLDGAFSSAGPESVCVYQNTSGSTNIPKTFALSLGRLFLLRSRYAKEARERRVLRTGSIEFDAHRLSRMASLLAGNTSVFLRHLNLRNMIALCESAEVSNIHMGAYKLASLLQSDRGCPTRLPSFTSVQTGGARVPGRLRQELRSALTDNLWVLYATSEVGLISTATPDQHEGFPEGVGFPADGVEVQIVDSEGGTVASGEIGQIRIRKDGMAKGYVAEVGRASNFENGWFYPHDLVSRRENEPLIYHGRADDVMILNGINVFPSAIEDTLESHPAVKEAVAYAISSRIHGEIPVAAVIVNEDAKEEISHLMDHCRRILGIRAPRQITVVDRIPRNAAGKPLRRELKAARSLSPE